MAKGGYQKRRIENKKQQERARRKRHQRNRKLIQVLVGLTVLALIAGLSLAFIGNSNEDSLANPSTTPTPSPTPFPTPPACTTPSAKTVGKKQFSNPPCLTIDSKKTYTATMKTSMGTMKIDLYALQAPWTVNNFVFLARQKFYNNSIFHRVIPDFGGPGSDMVQAGDAVRRNGTGDPGYSFGDENMIPLNEAGFLAMANSGQSTNGSQFFLLGGNVSHLNQPGGCPGPSGCHSVFGRVTSGLDVIGKIADVAKGENDKPKKDVVLVSVTIQEK